MSLPLAGDACILRLSDGRSNPTYVPVEGLRLTGWKMTQNEVDVTTSVNEGWRRLLPGAGLRTFEMRVAGIYLGSPGEQLLRTAALSGAVIDSELTLDQGQALHGPFLISELSIESKVQEEATYSALLLSAGLIRLG